MTALPVAALALGVVGSTHCVAMCGGMVGLARAAGRAGALPIADEPRAPDTVVVAQHLGRIASYGLAGALAGGAGRLAVAGWQAGLELAAGFAMIGLGLFLCGLLPAFAGVEALGAPLWRVLRPLGTRLLPLTTPWHGLAFGALWGWLPCGLVYSALSLATLAGSPAYGALTMLAFGAGTLPALAAVGALVRALAQPAACGRRTGWLARLARSARIRVAAGAAVAMLGALHLTLAAARLHEPSASCHSVHPLPAGELNSAETR